MTSQSIPCTADDVTNSDKGNHLPFWEQGSGHYGKTVGKQTNRILEATLSSLQPYLDRMLVKQGEAFTIGDYGTNDGASSMALLTSIIGHLREKHGEALPIQVIYEDQEKNDFNSLFRWLLDDSSYVSNFSNVYPLATNTNFFKQCVPDGTFDIIFCIIAAHWLERAETRFKNTFVHCFASEEEQKRFNAEADRDWTKFLRLRAKELKPGGLLIIVNASREASAVLGSDGSSGDAIAKDGGEGVTTLGRNSVGLLAELHHTWKELRDKGVITQTEFEDCIMEASYRTAEEITAPFTKSSSMKEAGLTLAKYEELWQPCFFKSQWEEKLKTEGVDDRESYAQSLVSASRVWSQSSFENSLWDMRSAEEKAAILDELYQTFEKRLARKDPRSFRTHYLVSQLVAKKDRVREE